MTPDGPDALKDLRPTLLVERRRAALYHALVTADPLADVYHHPLTASFVGHYFTALGPAIGRYREPAEQDRFAREEAVRFLALLAQAERARGAPGRALPAPCAAVRRRRRAMREEGASRQPRSYGLSLPHPLPARHAECVDRFVVVTEQ